LEFLFRGELRQVKMADKESGKDRQDPVVARNTHQKSRRRWDRLPLAIPVFVRGLDKQGNTFLEFTAAFNINRGGMLLACTKELPPSEPVELEIPFAKVPWPQADHQFIRHLKGRIAHATPVKGCHLYGIEFNPCLPYPDSGEWNASAKDGTD
jgi:PilZ domain